MVKYEIPLVKDAEGFDVVRDKIKGVNFILQLGIALGTTATRAISVLRVSSVIQGIVAIGSKFGAFFRSTWGKP